MIINQINFKVCHGRKKKRKKKFFSLGFLQFTFFFLEGNWSLNFVFYSTIQEFIVRQNERAMKVFLS